MQDPEIYEQFLSLCDNGFARIAPDGSITEVNKALCELTGRSSGELTGAGLDILFDEASLEMLGDLFATGECVECRTIAGELMQKRGEPRNVEIYINCTRGVHWLLVKNKSFRKEMEEKLRQSELMLSTCLESLPFDFWINDADNQTWMQNSYSKALWGDVKGQRPEEVGSGAEITSQWLETTKRALNGEVVNGELTYIINNQKKIFRNILAPILDGERLLGILGMNIDITDLKDALEQKGRLLKEVHHRVNNSLQMINSIINLESTELECGEDNRVFEDLINRIEAISLVHEKLNEQDSDNMINLADYIRELVDYIISGVELKKIAVNYELDDLCLDTDKVVLLGLIVNELVANSVSSAPETETLLQMDISLKSGDGEFLFKLVDRGFGLQDGCREGLWSPLGLKLIEALAQQLDARLDLDDNETCCRTILRIRL